MSKIDNMEQTIQTIKGDNEKLMKENLSLKRQVASYKSANTNYRKKVAELKERVEHYKSLGIEGDGLYEQKIKELDETKKQFLLEIKELDAKKDVEIKRLSDLVDTEREKCNAIMAGNKDLKNKLLDMEELVEWHNSLPWYKRIAKIVI